MQSYPNRIYDHFLSSTGLSTDTRSLQPGQMFWALKGPSFNGNAFATNALEMGASFVVVDEKIESTDPRILHVEDGLADLQRLANHHRKQWGKPVIAVCGSNGKTTTKELITKALSVSKSVFATPGNFNNHIGVPLSLLRLKPEHDMAVIEMGANHPGEIADLCRIAEPDSGLITNVGKDHLEGFGSIEGSAEANAELFDFLQLMGGTAFINTADEWNQKLRSRVSRTYTFPGIGDDSPCENRSQGFYLTLKTPETNAIETRLTGQYNFHNLACAVAVGKYYGLDSQKVVEALATYSPANNRSQVVETGRNRVISDAYNANPSSVLAALQNLLSLNVTERKIAILGDMLELGADSGKEHFEMGQWASQRPEIQFYVVGSEMKSFSDAFPEVPYFDRKEVLENHLSANPVSGAIVLLKGSRGMKMETLLPLL